MIIIILTSLKTHSTETTTSGQAIFKYNGELIIFVHSLSLHKMN